MPKEPIDINVVRFEVYEEDERREGRPAVEATWRESSEYGRPRPASILLDEVYEILKNLGHGELRTIRGQGEGVPSVYREEGMTSEFPRIDNLDIEGQDSVLISLKPNAPATSPDMWHAALRHLKKELERTGE